MTTATLITTFSDKNYDEYARFFLESLVKNLDPNINVIIYTDTPKKLPHNNWKNLILEESCPELTAFKERNKDKPRDTFLYDAVRFSHKSYAIVHASKICETDQLIWLDADTQILSYLSKDYVTSHLPKGKFCSYLGRHPMYTETGWLSFDMTNEHAKEFFSLWQDYYDNDKIYELEAQLDCHVFDAVRKKLESDKKIDCYNISPNTGKGHFNVRFKGHLYHFKGDRKEPEKRERFLKKALSQLTPEQSKKVRA